MNKNERPWWVWPLAGALLVLAAVTGIADTMGAIDRAVNHTPRTCKYMSC